MPWACPECGDDSANWLCSCGHCEDCCECERDGDDFDADELGLDPEEGY